MIPQEIKNKKLYKGEFFNCLTCDKNSGEQYCVLCVESIHEYVACPIKLLSEVDFGIKVICSHNMKTLIIATELYVEIVKTYVDINLPCNLPKDANHLLNIKIQEPYTEDNYFKEMEFINKRQIDQYIEEGYSIIQYKDPNYPDSNSIFIEALKTKEAFEFGMRHTKFRDLVVIHQSF